MSSQLTADDDSFVHELLAYMECGPPLHALGAHPLGGGELLAPLFSSGALEVLALDSHSSGSESATPKREAGASSSSSPRARKRSAHNASRERMQHELKQLRVESAELAHTLAALLKRQQQVQQQQTQQTQASASPQSQLLLLAAWERIAQRQLEHRRRAEMENELLKAQLQRSQALADTLQQTLQQWNSEFAAPPTQQPHISMQSSPFADPRDVALYEQLAADLDATALRIDEVFAANGLSRWRVGAVVAPVQIKTRAREMGGVACYTEFLDAEVFPFPIDEVFQASWRVWKQRSLSKNCVVYDRLARSRNTFASKSCCEFRLNSANVSLKFLSVTRAFRFEDRFVYVWRGVTKSDEQFPGAIVHESGWQVVRAIDDAGDGGSVILTCTQMEPRGIDASGASTDDTNVLVLDVAPLANLVLSAFKVDMQEVNDAMMDALLRESELAAATEPLALEPFAHLRQ